MPDPTGLIRRETPEERELGRKRAELAAIEGVLAEEELALATQRAQVFLFERRYMREVGSRYAELDDLEARLTQALAERNPNDEVAQYRAEAARKQADATSDAKRDQDQPTDPAEPRHFEPSDELKQLYRQGAKRIHPDLAAPGTSTDEHQRRTATMAAFSSAYARGDAIAMRAMLDDWEARPESVEGANIAAQLIRIIRQLAQVERRLDAMRVELEELRQSAMFKLWEKAQEAEQAGRDLIAELATDLDKKIAGLRESLAVLQASPKPGR